MKRSDSFHRKVRADLKSDVSSKSGLPLIGALLGGEPRMIVQTYKVGTMGVRHGGISSLEFPQSLLVQSSKMGERFMRPEALRSSKMRFVPESLELNASNRSKGVSQ